MIYRDRVRMLLGRLSRICSIRGWEGDVWSDGVEVIQRKYRVMCYLGSFVPCDIESGERPTSEVKLNDDWGKP